MRLAKPFPLRWQARAEQVRVRPRRVGGPRRNAPATGGRVRSISLDLSRHSLPSVSRGAPVGLSGRGRLGLLRWDLTPADCAGEFQLTRGNLKLIVGLPGSIKG